MPKKDPKKFIGELIESYWAEQRLIEQHSADNQQSDVRSTELLEAKIDALQEVYSHLTDGEEYGQVSSNDDDDDDDLYSIDRFDDSESEDDSEEEDENE